MVTDVSERRAAEAEHERLQERLIHQAFHDALTGLPNRALFLDRLERVFKTRDKPAPSAVMFLDLDNFKVMNDSLGHEAGDELLKIIAQPLLACVRPEDTVARLGGDEFTVLLTDAKGHAPLQIAERILQQIREPVAIRASRFSPAPALVSR